MSTISFKDLKSGIVKLITSKTPVEVSGPPPEEGSALDGMDMLTLSLDGVAVMLTHCAPVQADRVFLFCDFGDPPPELELAALRRLMEMNFVMYRGNSPSFVRDPESGHVMLMSEVPMVIATPEDVLAYMHSLSKQALDWRKTYFLPEDALVAPTAQTLV